MSFLRLSFFLAQRPTSLEFGWSNALFQTSVASLDGAGASFSPLDSCPRKTVHGQEFGDPPEHDHTGVDRDQVTGAPNGSSSHNQICCHPEDEFYDGQGLVVAVAVHPRQMLA